MIEIKNVKKAFGNNKVLTDISITVESGCIYGLIGKNGAGKTTLLNILAGLSEADDGEIIVENGQECKVGFLPDVPAFFDYLTAEEYIDYLIMNKSDIEQRNRLLNMVKIPNNVRIKTMSRGMKQRLGIAAVLVTNPKIILLDEPTSALDPAGRMELMDILHSLKNEGRTIILSTHILSDMEKICDKVGFLHEGVIKKEIEPAAIDADSLNIRVLCAEPVDVNMINIPNYKAVQIDSNLFELTAMDKSIDKRILQKQLFDGLANVNTTIIGINSLRPNLDTMFQEVCM